MPKQITKAEYERYVSLKKTEENLITISDAEYSEYLLLTKKYNFIPSPSALYERTRLYGTLPQEPRPGDPIL